MTLEIITPEKTIYSGTVTLVQFPGTSGSFAVLNNHAPMIATLKAGKIKIKDTDDKISFIEVNGGVVQVENNNVLVLAS